MTRAQLRSLIQGGLNDPEGVFHTDDDINTVIDEGMETLAELVPGVKRTYTIARRSGVGIYQLLGVGDDIQAVYRLWLPDLERRLEPVTLTDLDAQHRLWQTISGDPWWWAPVDWRSFVIWPIPATGGGWLQVDCYCWPQALLDDEDTPELHEADHEALIAYGALEGACAEWDAARARAALTLLDGFRDRAQAQSQVKQVQARHWRRSMAR